MNLNLFLLRARKSARKIENSMRSKISRGFEAINISFKCRIQGFVLVTSFTSIDWLQAQTRLGWLTTEWRTHETQFCATKKKFSGVAQAHVMSIESKEWRNLRLTTSAMCSNDLVRIMRACLACLESRVCKQTVSQASRVRNDIKGEAIQSNRNRLRSQSRTHSPRRNLKTHFKKAQEKTLNFATETFRCTNF